MDAASPARLYVTVLGALLIVFGIVGFFYSASFGSPGSVDTALGAFHSNGWINLLHIGAGAIGLLLADSAARGYALLLGLFYTGLAIWGFSVGDGTVLGLFPAGTGNAVLHLTIGLLGLLAFAGTQRSGRPARRAASTSPSAG